MNITKILLDLFFPEECVSCANIGASICESCVHSLVPPDPIPYSWITAVFSYQSKSMRTLIHNLKYKGNKRALYPLSQRIREHLLLYIEEYGDKKIVLIPVPSPRDHIRTRGYNQAEIIAHMIQRDLRTRDCEVSTTIQTKRHTSQVKTKNKKERLKNIQGSFFTHEHFEKDTLYIIIDDVITTGATMKEIKSILYRHGARYIIGCAVAH